MNRRGLPESIAIVGGGPVAAAAALAFAQAMPGVRVTLVPAPVDAAALADRWPLALPAAHAMLARLQCPPQLLLARGIATPRRATRFLDWSGDGAPWMVGDEPAAGEMGVPLHQLWLRAGEPVPFHALDPLCASVDAKSLPNGAETALHLDGDRLSAGMTALARQAGVTFTTTQATAVRHGPHGVDAVVLNDGDAVRADLFVDASGPPRLLATSDGFRDWRAVLPCDNLSIEPAARPHSSVDTYRATADGWRADWPGATVTACRSEAAGAGDAIRIAPGRLEAPLRGNVLALGESAVQPGPLGLAGFTLALSQIALALELLPIGADATLLADEYNRRAGQRADRMRDFLTLHYHGLDLLPPHDALPRSLAALLAQFGRHGTVPAADEDPVPREIWIATLIGQGLRPRRPHPIALGIPQDIARAAVLDVAGMLRRDPEHLAAGIARP